MCLVGENVRKLKDCIEDEMHMKAPRLIWAILYLAKKM